MSHQVENMFSVKETPWHGLGVILGEAPTTKEAIVAAGLDWKVELKPLCIIDSQEPVRANAIVRATDKRTLGVAGDKWTPLQNDEAFSWFDPFLASGDAVIETAGSLRHGERVWVLARLNREPSTIVPGDEVMKYLLLSNAHDGKVAVRVGFTPIRVVCANTLAAAHQKGVSALIRVQHRKSIVDTLDKVRDIMNVADRAFEATAEQYRFLASRGVSETDLEKYVQKVFKPKPVLNEETDELEFVTPPVILENVKELFEGGRGHDIPGVSGTYWGAYNAVTEYLSHVRGAEAATRLDGLWFGNGASLNARALTSAMEMAA